MSADDKRIIMEGQGKSIIETSDRLNAEVAQMIRLTIPQPKTSDIRDRGQQLAAYLCR